MQMLDLPVRHEQTVLVVEVFLAMHRAIKLILHKRAVVGMGPLHDDIERWLDPPLEAHDLVKFLGPVSLAGECFPAEASRESELLRLRQIGLAALQGMLGPLSILDVGVRPIPSDDISGPIAQWRRSKQEPTILSVEAPHARLDFLGISICQHSPPNDKKTGKIVRMDYDLPVPAERLLNGQAGIVEPPLVEVFGKAVGSRLPGESWDA